MTATEAVLVTSNEQHRTSRAELAAMSFLSRYRVQTTRRGYEITLRQWFMWCAEHNIGPLEATRPYIELFARELEATGRSASSLLSRSVAPLTLGSGGSVARATGSPPARHDVGVRLVVRVSRRAVGLGRVDRLQRLAPQHVRPVGDDLQVVGPHAQRHPAEVVNVHVVGHGGPRERQRHPVCSLHPALVEERPVPGPAVRSALPEPAPVTLLDLLPEPLSSRRRAVLLEECRGPRPGAFPRCVVAVAEPLGVVLAPTSGDRAGVVRSWCHGLHSNRVRDDDRARDSIARNTTHAVAAFVEGAS